LSHQLHQKNLYEIPPSSEKLYASFLRQSTVCHPQLQKEKNLPHLPWKPFLASGDFQKMTTWCLLP
jgi:hypothetical protein